MLKKIKKYTDMSQFLLFKDVRVIGLLVFGVIVLLVTWSGLGAIQTNFVLQKQVNRLQEENKVGELENTNLKLKNQYFNTEQYLELQARRQFGKAAPGETMILIPKSVALAKTKDLSTQTTTKQQVSTPQKPQYQQNFEAWMSFFFNRGAS